MPTYKYKGLNACTWVRKLKMKPNQEPVKFETTVSSAAAIDKAYHQNKTLLQVEPSHKVSQQYRDLALEVHERVLKHEALKAAARAAANAPTPSPAPAGASDPGVMANA